MKRALGSLRGRITLVIVFAALTAVLATGLISLQLVNTATLKNATAQLAAQADVLSHLPPDTTVEALGNSVKLALGDTQVAYVHRFGRVQLPILGMGFMGTTPASESIRVSEFPAITTIAEASAMGISLLDARVAIVHVANGDTKKPILEITASMTQALLQGHPVSVTTGPASAPLVVEGRPTANGGAIVLLRTEASLSQTGNTYSNVIETALVIGLVFSLICGIVLSDWIARPLIKTAAAARRMAAGERGLPVSVRRPTEVGRVATALATLDSTLAASETRQREFLLAISHELRTPLTALRGYGEAMTDGLIHEGDVQTVGATLVTETHRLDRFVTDLLELSQLEADDFTIDKHPTDVADLVAKVAETWQGSAVMLDVTVAIAPFQLSPAAASLTTDDRRLRQVIDGLVENALRLTPRGGRVTIGAHESVGLLHIDVTDTGPGLTAADLAVAFQRGVLLGRYRNERPVGTGLGLSIAARLVTRLGGSIRAANAPNGDENGVGETGGGAIFTVSLPLP